MAEPLSPPVCFVLLALLSSADGHSLSARDETSLDTVRIQRAIDHCSAGKAVRLAAQDGRRAFLSGPIQLRSGVTLFIDKDVVIFASREAHDFQYKQGSCGVVDDKGTGCRPLVSCEGTTQARLTGAGTIDGRGGAAILGETYSWWDLALEARLTNGKVNAPDLLSVDGCDHFFREGVVLRHSPKHPGK